MPNRDAKAPDPARTKRLGDILVDSGLITAEQLARALDDQNNFGGRIGSILFDQGVITEREYLRALSQQMGISATELAGIYIPEAVMKMIPRETAWEIMAVPLAVNPSGATPVLLLAMADPTDEAARLMVERITGCRVQPALAFENTIREVLMDYYQDHFGTGDYHRPRAEGGPAESSAEGGRDYLPAEPRLFIGPAADTPQPAASSGNGKDAAPGGHGCDREHDRFSLEMRAFLELLIRKGIIGADEYSQALKELQAPNFVLFQPKPKPD